jgi:hypothetical protein
MITSHDANVAIDVHCSTFCADPSGAAAGDGLLSEQFGSFTLFESCQQLHVDSSCHPAVAPLAPGLQPAGVIGGMHPEGQEDAPRWYVV